MCVNEELESGIVNLWHSQEKPGSFVLSFLLNKKKKEVSEDLETDISLAVEWKYKMTDAG